MKAQDPDRYKEYKRTQREKYWKAVSNGTYKKKQVDKVKNPNKRCWVGLNNLTKSRDTLIRHAAIQKGILKSFRRNKKSIDREIYCENSEWIIENLRYQVDYAGVFNYDIKQWDAQYWIDREDELQQERNSRKYNFFGFQEK